MNRRFLMALPLAALVAACATTERVATPVSVADTIARDPQLSTLNGLVHKAGLADTLKAAGPFTVFAPTNDAFQAVPPKTLAELSGDPARLKDVLIYHLVPARLPAAEVRNASVKSAQGTNLALAKAGEFVTVEDALVQTADIAATNGVVHKVDRVLLPPVRR